MRIFVCLLAPPQITQPPPAEIVTAPGVEVVISCKAAGFSVPSITWLSPAGSAITSSRDVEIVETTEDNIEKTSTITFSDLMADDLGTYQCQAMNSVGTVSTSTEIEFTGMGYIHTQVRNFYLVMIDSV